jgi:hypothetical protein
MKRSISKFHETAVNIKALCPPKYQAKLMVAIIKNVKIMPSKKFKETYFWGFPGLGIFKNSELNRSIVASLNPFINMRSMPRPRIISQYQRSDFKRP